MQKLFRSALAGALLALQAPAKAGDMNVPVASPVPASAPRIGSVIAAGGGDLPPQVYAEFLRRAGGNNARLVFIPTASERADTAYLDEAHECWKGESLPSGVSSVLLHTRDRSKANDPNFVKQFFTNDAGAATGVWIGGGKQEYLEAAYAGTEVEQELHDVVRRGGVVAGTSAGAAIMSKVMIRKSDKDGQLFIGTGFDLIPNSVIDQHYLMRNREWRLRKALGLHKDRFGLGLDEGTAMILEGDLSNPLISVIGNSKVMFHKTQDAHGIPLEHVEKVNLSILGEPKKKDLPMGTNTAIAGME